MKQVLMSIKPQYVKQIIDGTKTIEYRKTRFHQNVDSIIIYASSPIKKVIGEVELLDTLVDSPSKIWDQTYLHGGCTKDEFDAYYKGKDKAIAYVLGNVTLYDNPKTLVDYGIYYYPQSYVYLRELES
ncbi:MAG: ASCH domain-containing protein [Erysipelotrichaceae bacterium]|nr:ASCH domain-containing protein [Erysipelotrichaceae bacterium]